MVETSFKWWFNGDECHCRKQTVTPISANPSLCWWLSVETSHDNLAKQTQNHRLPKRQSHEQSCWNYPPLHHSIVDASEPDFWVGLVYPMSPYYLLWVIQSLVSFRIQTINFRIPRYLAYYCRFMNRRISWFVSPSWKREKKFTPIQQLVSHRAGGIQHPYPLKTRTPSNRNSEELASLSSRKNGI